MAEIKVKKTVGYVRVSTRDQVLEGYSLDAQRQKISEFCQQDDMELVKIYADEGISGSSVEKRPGIQSLLAMLETRNLIWSLSGRTAELHVIRKICLKWSIFFRETE